MAALVVLLLTVGCREASPHGYGSRLEMRLTVGDSPEYLKKEIEQNLAKIYPRAEIATRYQTYQVTNGVDRWAFFQVGNGPRGIGMFNLHCYQQVRPDAWVLRAYVPVNYGFYTNGVDHELMFKLDPDYLKVLFRGEVVFTAISKR